WGALGPIHGQNTAKSINAMVGRSGPCIVLRQQLRYDVLRSDTGTSGRRDVRRFTTDVLRRRRNEVHEGHHDAPHRPSIRQRRSQPKSAATPPALSTFRSSVLRCPAKAPRQRSEITIGGWIEGRNHMAATVREAIRELMEQTMATMDALLEASDRELAKSSSHACAQGKDVWTLLTNDIDHEKIHTGQVLEGRYESRNTASPMERLVAEWLAERARFIGSLVGLTDAQFNRVTAEGQWTYRVIAKHVLTLEQDSLKTMAADQAARAAG